MHMKINESWRAIKGYHGQYEVSDLGRVRSLNYLGNTGKVKVLKLVDTRNGYLVVNLCKNGKPKKFLVHRLVVEAFIGPIPRGMVVNHLNEIKTDNRLVNLEITTYKKNNNHGTRNERIAEANSKSQLGNTNANKELQLTHATTCAKYTFSNSYEASTFFGFKSKTHVGALISQARKCGEKFIKIKGEKHYFSQAS